MIRLCIFPSLRRQVLHVGKNNIGDEAMGRVAAMLASGAVPHLRALLVPEAAINMQVNSH
jgi:hypothetical protein